MNEGLIPARYAKALYLVACEKSVADRLYEMMKSAEYSFAFEQSFHRVLSNPYIPDSDKQALLMTAAGASDSDTVFCDFLKLLAKNRRLDMARGIANAYIKLFRSENRIYDVRVVSAAPLASDMEKRLLSQVSRHLNGGKMELSASVDPDLIGGFTVSVGNERIDASISNELKQLRLNLITK